MPLHALESRAWFEVTLDRLARFYRFIDAAELEWLLGTGRPLGSVCHLTFDDGHRSFEDIALPVLRERSIPASLFVSPSVIVRGDNYWFQELSHLRHHVNDEPIRAILADLFATQVERLSSFSVMSLFLSLKRQDMTRALSLVRAHHEVPSLAPQNISSERLREIDREGLVTIGAHSLEHPILANETDERSEFEISESVRSLASLLGRPVTTFAYPNGMPDLDFGPREQRSLRQAGIRMAFSTLPGFISPSSDRLALPRGGCPSVNGERAPVTLLRLALLPWWDVLRERTGRRTHSEALERRSILKLGLLRRA
jgi:peptidoglycan/xylan/chitin deacetylase (PgdA/CDA1 family)